MKKLSLIIGMLLLVAAVAIAKEPHKFKSEKKRKSQLIEAVTKATPPTTKGETVITGILMCLSETLQKEKGANAQCSVYGHRSVLKVEKAVFSGSWRRDPDYEGKWPPPDLPRPDPAYKGQYFSFLPNDNSAELSKEKYYGKKVIIVGRIYPEANLLGVRFVKFSPPKKKK